MGLGLNLGLAIIFLVLRAIEWNSLNFTWASDAHGSIVWTILFLHSYDIVADVLMTAVLIVIVASGHYGPRQRIGVHVDSVLWYFLVGIWIPLYGVIYWAPRLIGGSPMKQAVLGTGLVLAPMAWFASLEANFALAPLACGGHGKSMLLLVSAVALGLAVAGGLLAWTQRNVHRRLAFSGTVISALFSHRDRQRKRFRT